jgi:dihydrolipoamide dehydrogenase
MQELSVDVAIIGAGTAGITAYRGAIEHTDSVLLIEGGPYGTLCARVGCMPSKLLIAAAEAAHAVVEAPRFGVHPEGTVRIDGAAVMDRVRRERDRFVSLVLESIETLKSAHKLRGHARFLDNHRLQVGFHAVVTAKAIVIATGSLPRYPDAFKTLGNRLITSDQVFEWQDLPGSMAVFGAGAIGLELGQALHRLGVKTFVFGHGGRLGPLTDPAVVKSCHPYFAKEFYLNLDAHVNTLKNDGDQALVTFTGADGQVRSEAFDYVLAATGRVPNVTDLGLENTELALDKQGVPLFDPYTLQAGDSPVFIAGDVNGERPLLHEAADEGRIAGSNAGRYPDIRVGLRRTPLGVVFCDPQIAMAGRRYRELEPDCFAIGEASFEDQGRSRIMAKNQGLLRVYAQHGTGRLLGAEMCGPQAEHIGHLLAWACQQQLTITQMLDMPFYHPVVEEGLRTALKDAQHKLHLGPSPVAYALDCGPGA